MHASQPLPHPSDLSRSVDPSRSFDLVADAYDRGRPSYPREAAEWLVGRSRATVLELGAGTGKLTEMLLAGGHSVIATDHSETMLRRLRSRAAAARAVVGTAERIPLASRSVDVVTSGQAFHWFDPRRSLPEIARVLRAGGTLSMVWNQRDERIPWVKRLGELIGGSPGIDDVVAVIDDSGMFEQVETSTFRFWQPMQRDSLRDLVASRSAVAILPEVERERRLRKVDALYDEYDRGAGGMRLPYLTHTFRTVVLPWARRDDDHRVLAPDHRPHDVGGRPGGDAGAGGDPPDADSLLIDFR